MAKFNGKFNKGFQSFSHKNNENNEIPTFLNKSMNNETFNPFKRDIQSEFKTESETKNMFSETLVSSDTNENVFDTFNNVNNINNKNTMNKFNLTSKFDSVKNMFNFSFLKNFTTQGVLFDILKNITKNKKVLVGVVLTLLVAVNYSFLNNALLLYKADSIKADIMSYNNQALKTE
jgi:hypothetical protein